MQQHVDHPAVAEHRDRVVGIGRGDEIVDRRADTCLKRVLVDRAGQMPLGQARPFLRHFRTDLLDGDVQRKVAVVLRESIVDLDG